VSRRRTSHDAVREYVYIDGALYDAAGDEVGRRRRQGTAKGIVRPAASWFSSVVVVGILLSAVGSQAVAYYFPHLLVSVDRRRLVSVQAGYDQAWYGGGWALALEDDPDLSQGPETDGQDPRLWVMEKGGVDIGETRLKVVLRGESALDALITGARVEILARDEPWTTTAAYSESAGAHQTFGLYFDLDEERPLARHYDSETGEPGDAFFAGSFYTLANREIVVFEVIAATSSCYCEWVLEFDVEAGNRKETIVVDDGGEPFKTSAYMYEGYGRSWTWTWWDPPARFEEFEPEVYEEVDWES
jgi:hypothetical protein